MPRELVTFLKSEATQGGRDLTAFVVRHLEGLRTWFGLPAAATSLLDADRKALGLERYEYLFTSSSGAASNSGRRDRASTHQTAAVASVAESRRGRGRPRAGT